MINRFRRFLRRMQIWNNNRKLKIQLTRNVKIPTIKINEKHEKTIKRIVRTITVIGILISIISFSDWYYSLGVTIVLFIVDQFFEKVLFTYTVMLVQPFPKKWDGSKWSLMAVGYFEDHYVLAFGFDSKVVADDFFDTLLSWNDGKTINDGDVCLTLVLENSNNYSVHVYPLMQRDFVREGINRIKNEKALEKYGKEQTNLVVQMSFRKVFPNGQRSAYNLLKNNNKDILICTYDTSNFNQSRPESYESLRPYDDRRILCKEIKVKRRKELDIQKESVEYYNIPTI